MINFKLKRKMIIYKATNSVSGKIYIGKTVNTLQQRISEHKRHSKNGAMTFHKAIQKYGFDSFEFTILFECEDAELLTNKEIELIKQFNSTNKKIGYNSSIGGDGVSGGENHPLFGKKRPEFGESISGNKHPNYGNIGELSPRYGQKHTEETKRKISNSLIGNIRNVDKTLYEFEHPEYGKVITTKYEMKKKYNLEGKCIALLCRGERNTHKGWKIICCVSGTDSQLKQKRSKALPLGESATSEAHPIGYAVGG